MANVILFFVLWVPFMTGSFFYWLWMYSHPLQGTRMFFGFNRLVAGKQADQLFISLARRMADPRTNVAVRSVWSVFTIGPARILGVRLSLNDQADAIEYLVAHPSDLSEPTDSAALAWGKYRRVMRRMALLGMFVSGGMLAAVLIGGIVALAVALK